jgi:hypothetical protein
MLFQRTKRCHTDFLDWQTRAFAAVLFRRISSKTRRDPESTDLQPITKDLFMTLAPPQRAAIREKLLLALTNEGTATVRNKTSDAVAEIARQYVEEGTFGTNRQRIRDRAYGSPQGSNGQNCCRPCLRAARLPTQVQERRLSEYFPLRLV